MASVKIFGKCKILCFFPNFLFFLFFSFIFSPFIFFSSLLTYFLFSVIYSKLVFSLHFLSSLLFLLPSLFFSMSFYRDDICQHFLSFTTLLSPDIAHRFICLSIFFLLITFIVLKIRNQPSSNKLSKLQQTRLNQTVHLFISVHHC